MSLFLIGFLIVILINIVLCVYGLNKYIQLPKKVILLCASINIVVPIFLVARFFRLFDFYGLLDLYAFLQQLSTYFLILNALFSVFFFILFVSMSPMGVFSKTISLSNIRVSAVFLVVFGLSFTSLGIHQSTNIQQKNYEIKVSKQSTLTSLNIVYLSDMHLGTSTSMKQLDEIASKISKQKVDLIVFGGDIFDENTPQALMDESVSFFTSLQSTYGSYYVFGNHEYYTPSQQSYIETLEKGSVHSLKEEVVEVANSFLLVGRDDIRLHKDRASLNTLLNDVDVSLPIIVLDHQPNIEDNKDVDLQLSGHTHNGQIFPGNILVNRSHQVAYGIAYNLPYTMIVSSGVGTWGIPFRLGTQSEIIKINITFQQQ